MGILGNAYQLLTRVFIGSLSILRRIPIVDNLLGELRLTYLNPVVVRRVNSRSSDLISALDLYSKSLPQTQRFESADIIRWLREDEQQRKTGGGEASFDCFLVAKFRGKVCGLVLFHYYPKYLFAFFAYMVTGQRPGIPAPNAISDSLMKKDVCRKLWKF